MVRWGSRYFGPMVAVVLLLVVVGLVTIRTRPPTDASRPQHETAAERASGSPAAGSEKRTSSAPEARAIAVNRGQLWRTALAKITEDDIVERGRRQVRRVSAAQVHTYLQSADMDADAAEPLRDLLASWLAFRTEFRARAHAQGLPAEGAEFENQLATEKSNLESRIRAILGADEFERMRDTIHGADVRLYAIEMVGEAAIQGEPLSKTQIANINEAVEALLSSRMRTRPNDAPDPELGANLFDLKAFVALESALSKKQLQILQDIRYEDHLFREAGRLRERAKYGLE